MSNSKISALTSATTPLAGTETLPIVQSSTTKQVSVANLTAGRDVTGLSFTGGNVKISGNTIATTDTNGNLTIDPNGSGYTIVAAPTNGTIAQMGNLSSRTFYLKQSNFGGYDNDTLINESDSGVGQFQWKNSGATLWTMNYTGNLTPAGAAKGINFTANTPAACMTSQLLNWYEEGTWTPNQGSGLTVVGAFSSTGKYTRVGRNLTISGTVTGATSVAVAAAGIITTNLPFTVGTAGHGNVTNAALTSFSAIICTSTNVTSAGAIAATGTLTFSATYFV
jgi:hypothetical protein